MLKRRAARKSLAAYINYLETGFTLAHHHYYLIDKLERVASGEIKRLMIFMPPGSAKSSYGSIYFPAWYLGRYPTKSVIAASHTGELAERFGRRVRNLVASPEYNNIFALGVSADSSAAGRWDTTKGGEYYAVGVGGSVTGRRADLGLIDDPVKSREDADSETQREKVWEWYKADFFTRLKPNAGIILIMTRWHEDDLAGRLLKDAEEGGEQWEVVSIPMEAEDDDPLGRKPGDMLWPEWFTEDMVNQAKRDARNWLALYQQKPRPIGGGEFRREWLRYYHESPDQIEGGTNKYILVDAASEKKKTSDYTAIWVIGLNHDGNYYVLDMIRDKMSLTQRGAEVMRLHRKWKPLQVRYEKYGMMADIEYIRTIQAKENYRFDIVEVGGATPKNDRIRRLVPIFEGGKVYLPQTMHKTEYTGKTFDLVDSFINQEYLAFPVGTHDDMLDSLARLLEPDLSLVWPQQTTTDGYNRNKKAWGSAWSA